MSLLQYLQLQPVDIREDGSVSELDSYREDDMIDLTSDEGETDMIDSWLHFDNDMQD